MKASELWELTDEELLGRLNQCQQEHYNLRFQKVTGQLESPLRIRQAKKDIARINTVIRARQLKEGEMK